MAILLFVGALLAASGCGDKRSVLKSLRRVADDRRPRVLPVPVPGSIDGELPCQGKRMKRFSQ
jgi:hypothetical protein